MGVQCISPSFYYGHLKSLVYPVIQDFWTKQQDDLLSSLRVMSHTLQARQEVSEVDPLK